MLSRNSALITHPFISSLSPSSNAIPSLPVLPFISRPILLRDTRIIFVCSVVILRFYHLMLYFLMHISGTLCCGAHTINCFLDSHTISRVDFSLCTWVTFGTYNLHHHHHHYHPHATTTIITLTPPPPPASPCLPSSAGGAKQWKMVSLLVAFPAIGLCMVNAFTGDHDHPPEFIPYEHLRLRTKVSFFFVLKAKPQGQRQKRIISI